MLIKNIQIRGDPDPSATFDPPLHFTLMYCSLTYTCIKHVRACSNKNSIMILNFWFLTVSDWFPFILFFFCYKKREYFSNRIFSNLLDFIFHIHNTNDSFSLDIKKTATYANGNPGLGWWHPRKVEVLNR
jgi:hypothetical protein